jgi:hypothetical protein
MFKINFLSNIQTLLCRFSSGFYQHRTIKLILNRSIHLNASSTAMFGKVPFYLLSINVSPSGETINYNDGYNIENSKLQNHAEGRAYSHLSHPYVGRFVSGNMVAVQRMAWASWQPDRPSY